jgi:hypothetical protein
MKLLQLKSPIRISRSELLRNSLSENKKRPAPAGRFFASKRLFMAVLTFGPFCRINQDCGTFRDRQAGIIFAKQFNR